MARANPIIGATARTILDFFTANPSKRLTTTDVYDELSDLNRIASSVGKRVVVQAVHNLARTGSIERLPISTTTDRGKSQPLFRLSTKPQLTHDTQL